MTARAHRRRRAAASLIRMTLVTTVLLVVYYHAPLNQPGDLRLALWLVAGLLTLGIGVAWQARVIATSDTPRLQAVETAGVALPALLVLYASTYTVMSAADPSSFTQVRSRSTSTMRPRRNIRPITARSRSGSTGELRSAFASVPGCIQPCDDRRHG